MNRTDSAFDETFRLEVSKNEPPLVHRSNTAPTRHQKSKRMSPNLTSTSQSPRTPTMETNRPASEKPATRKSGEPRRKSIALSDNSTTKSRHRGGHNSNSLPSSRRTSCTVVDPSRPARHYRIKSSQTCPTINRDIDDVLALHFRSCSLFQNPGYHSSGLPSPTISGYGVGAPDTDFASMRGRPGTAPQTGQSKEGAEQQQPLFRKESEETVGIATHETVDMTMHWMSPGTRRTQYEKIDRANSGFRGFFKRVTPRCVSGPLPQKFYDYDGSDAGSVRRYRMDMDEEEHEDEKGNLALRMQHRKLERSTMPKTNTKTKRWGCF